MTGRVSCKSGYGELVRGPPANDGRDQLGSTGKLGAKTMIALPADQNHTHVKCVGNWRQEARICDQAILLLSCEQWFLQDGRSVRPGETTARRVSFFLFVLKKEKKTPDRRLRGTQRNLSKNCIHGISLWARAQEVREKPFWDFICLGIHCQDHKSHLWLKLFPKEVSRSAVYYTQVAELLTFPGAVCYVFCRN